MREKILWQGGETAKNTDRKLMEVKGDIHTTDVKAISPTGTIIMTNTISMTHDGIFDILLGEAHEQ